VLLVEQRTVGTLGLFFSAFGYTPPAFESTEYLRPIRVLLFDPIDITWALGHPGGMMKMVRRKWVLALRSGKSHIAVTEPIDLLGGEFPDADHSLDHGEPA
ncbi:MAG: hypothetical protein WKF75_12265, partial [Singulisphaera sp.]